MAEAAAKLEPPKNIKLKDPKDWKIAGKPLKRLDTLDKLTGKQVYGADLKLPGMLNAAIKDCPVQGGKIVSFDAAKIANMPGVKKVVQVGDIAVAVVADTWWHAKTALDALPVVWDEGQNAKVSSATIAACAQGRPRRTPTRSSATRTATSTTRIANAAKKVEAVYAYPYQNHARMEPMNATARYTADDVRGLEPDAERRSRASAPPWRRPACPPTSARSTGSTLGGGFGRRGAFTDYVTQAVLIAKQMPGDADQAVVVARRGHDPGHYHPIMQCKLTGGFDANNELTGLRMRMSGQSILAGISPQNLDNGTRPRWPSRASSPATAKHRSATTSRTS